MKKFKLAFVFENVFQQYYAEFLHSQLHMKMGESLFISRGSVKQEFLELSKDSLFLEYIKVNHELSAILKERKLAKLIVEQVLSHGVTDVLLFKDHMLFHSILIRKLSKSGVKCHLIEEGLSMYVIKRNGEVKNVGLKSVMKYRIRQLITFISGGGISIDEFGMNKRLSNVFAFEPDLVPGIKKSERLFPLPGRIWANNVSLNAEKLDSKLKIRSGRDSILILVSPFVYLGKKSLEEQHKVLQKIIEVVNDSGCRAVLKVHPLEGVEIYSSLQGDIEFINYSEIPAELLLINSSFVGVISEGSSASIHAGRTFGVKSVILSSSDFLSGTFQEVDCAMSVIDRYCHRVDMIGEWESRLREILVDGFLMNSQSAGSDDFELIRSKLLA